MSEGVRRKMEARASALETTLERRFRFAFVAAALPALLMAAVAISVHYASAVSARYAVAFSRMAELAMRLEAHLGELAEAEAPDRAGPEQDFQEFLRLYSAIRAADPDGDEIAAGGEDAEADAEFRAIAGRHGVSPRDSAVELGLLGHDMPEFLEPIWEAEEGAEDGVGASGGASLEEIGGRIVVLADIPLSGQGPLSPPEREATAALADLVHHEAEPLLDRVAVALRAESEAAGVLPMALTGAVLLAAFGGALFVHYRVHGPLRGLVRQQMRELADEAERAQAAERAKSDFLANMSHEIRTPMNGVMGMTELLSGTELTQRQRAFVDIIDDSSKALLKLINEILDFSRIDAGQMRIDPAPFRLSRLVAEPAALVAKAASQKNVEIVARVAPGAPARLVGDFGRLRQVLVNLVGNAVKFTERGQVEIDLSTAPAGEGRVRLRIEVRDSGCGIPPEDLDRVFEKFTQVDGSVRRSHQGAGLGLAISSGLVQLMGGRIGVVSELGRGSAFHVELELPVDPEADAPSAPSRELAGLRVLVIDDNETNRLILQEQLSAWRFLEATAASGREGLTRLTREAERGAPFDLVVLDHHMPGMSGEEVLGELRATPGIATTPVILLGSLEDGPAVDRMRGLGLAAALTKPALASDLLDAIAVALATEVSARAAAPLVLPPPPPRPADGGAADVLVVDDNDVNRLLAMELAREFGLTAEGAEDGAEALAAIAERRPRIVLMDVSMPVLDGLEATRRLRVAEAAAGLPRLPVIGLTAHAFEGDRRRCLEAGMDEHLAKPVSGDLLRLAIDRWLDRPEARPAAEARRA